MPKCFVLLGGQGTRLYPLTTWIPKSMIPINGKPMISYVIQHLRSQDVTEIVLCLSDGYDKYYDQFIDYCADGTKWGVHIKYSIGSSNLNTAGRISHANDFVDYDFIVYYGDILSDINLKRVYQFHKQKGGIATIAVYSFLPTTKGVALIDDEGLVIEVKEKPLLPYPTNMGVYILQPRILEYIEPQHDFFIDLFPHLIDKGEKVYGCTVDCNWIDIGNFNNLKQASEFVKQNFEH